MELTRLFRLTKNKKGVVQDYSNKEMFSEVNWGELFVRPLLDREVNILNRFIEVVSNKVLVPERMID